MDRATRTGLSVSGLGHAGVLMWLVVGGLFFPTEPERPIAATEVSLLTSAEFAALVAAAPAPAPAPVPEPEVAVPAPFVPPEPVTAPPPRPEPAAEPAPPSEAAPDPVPPPPEVVEEAPPSPRPPLDAPEVAVLPNASPRPRPRPVQRVAPEPTDAPPPDARVAEEAVAAVTPDATPAERVEPPREATAPEEATTQIVTEATPTDEVTAPPISGAPATSARPRSRPVQAAAVVPPAAPAPPANTDDAIAAALASASAAVADTGTGGTGRAAAGPPLTSGEIDGLRRAIEVCWTVGSASSETLMSKVLVGIEMRPSGAPENVRLIRAEGPSEAARQTAFEIARRTINRCAANANLPPEKYDSWREIEMEFDYNAMRLR